VIGRRPAQFALGYHHTTVYEDYWVPVLERLATMVELPSVDFEVEPVRFDG
jgi:hypothetical protein